MKKVIIFFLFIITVVIIFIYQYFFKIHTVKKIVPGLFDTYFEIILVGRNPYRINNTIQELIDYAKYNEKIFNFYDEDSELYKLNNYNKDNFFQVSDTLFYLIEKGYQYELLSDRQFSILVGNYKNLYDDFFQNQKINHKKINKIQNKWDNSHILLKKSESNAKTDDNSKVNEIGNSNANANTYENANITTNEIYKRKSNANTNKSYINDNNSSNIMFYDNISANIYDFYNKIKVVPDDLLIDLGSVAKGWIIDELVRLSEKQNNIYAGIINGGGDLRVFSKNNYREWRIGVQHPRKNEFLHIFNLYNGSIATSGDYQRYFIIEDERFHHIIDTYSGYPANKNKSATVVSKNCLEADILSTLFFVLSIEETKRFIKKNNICINYIIMCNEGEVFLKETKKF